MGSEKTVTATSASGDSGAGEPPTVENRDASDSEELSDNVGFEKHGTRQQGTHYRIESAPWNPVGVEGSTDSRQSPRVDERCFLYCSQTSAGRMAGHQPNCKSICLRRVRNHEPLDPRRRPYGPDPRVPLPEEYQGVPDGLGGALVSRNLEGPVMPNGPSAQPKDPVVHPLVPGGDKGKENSVRFWRPGYYVWYSSSPRAALERVRLMDHPLWLQARVMAAWRAHGVREREAWAAHHERERAREGKVFFQGGPWPAGKQTLLPLPPDVPLLPSLRPLLAPLLDPTKRLLALTEKSLRDGDIQKFGGQVLRTAISKEPWVLARNAIRKVWDARRQGGDGGENL